MKTPGCYFGRRLFKVVAMNGRYAIVRGDLVFRPDGLLEGNGSVNIKEKKGPYLTYWRYVGSVKKGLPEGKGTIICRVSCGKNPIREYVLKSTFYEGKPYLQSTLEVYTPNDSGVFAKTPDFSFERNIYIENPGPPWRQKAVDISVNSVADGGYFPDINAILEIVLPTVRLCLTPDDLRKNNVPS